MSAAGASPVLIAASHGTSDPAGQLAVASLVHAVELAMPGTAVLGSFVDVQQPDVPASILRASALAGEALPVIVVPLLLSAGYHVRVDLAEAAREAEPKPVVVTGALGPDVRLARVLADRLAEAGLRPDDQIVLAAAGSSDANAVADCHLVGRMLAGRLDRDVTVGFISAAKPRVADAVASARARTAPGGRVVIATFLLAPGYFAGLAHDAGADVVTDPLLLAGEEPPAELVEIVRDLYVSAVDALCDGRVTAAYHAPVTPVTT